MRKLWVPSEVTGPTAVKRALEQIDAVREAVRTHPHDLMLANWGHVPDRRPAKDGDNRRIPFDPEGSGGPTCRARENGE
jgi:hypothetical protein